MIVKSVSDHSLLMIRKSPYYAYRNVTATYASIVHRTSSKWENRQTTRKWWRYVHVVKMTSPTPSRIYFCYARYWKWEDMVVSRIVTCPIRNCRRHNLGSNIRSQHNRSKMRRIVWTNFNWISNGGMYVQGRVLRVQRVGRRGGTTMSTIRIATAVLQKQMVLATVHYF